MNLYFFYKNNSCRDWYNCTIEAWQENDNTYRDGTRISSFLQLEKLRIHISKNPVETEAHHRYHACRFDHDFSADSCFGHWAKSKKEFLYEQTKFENSFRLIETNHCTFQRLKKAMVGIYLKYPSVNFTEHLMEDAPATRILI